LKFVDDLGLGKIKDIDLFVSALGPIFKNILANTIVTRQYNDVMGAVSTGLIDAAKINAIVPNVSPVAAPQRIISSS
jgi:hypothetical protein